MDVIRVNVRARLRSVFVTWLSCVVDFTSCGRRRRNTWKICTTSRCSWETSISSRL